MEARKKEASVSLRRCIKWGSESATEETSTLVLTSLQSCFVDIRVLLEEATLATNPSGLPYNGDVHSFVTEPQIPRNLIAAITVMDHSLARLDWGFAGVSSSTPASTDPATGKHIPAHSQWAHTIDSRCRNEEAITLVDEGDMSAISESLELEVGNMVYPKTGVATDYEEVWQALDPETVDDEHERVSAVFEMGSPEGEDDAKGSIVRVGRYVQGVVRRDDNVRVQRWMWMRHGESEECQSGTVSANRIPTTHGIWVRLIDIGSRDVQIPCYVALGTVDELKKQMNRLGVEGAMDVTRHRHWRLTEIDFF